MPTIGTTAQMILTGSAADPISFELHADADNADTINYSAAEDVALLTNVGELLPGQSITVTDFVGSLWIVAEAGTLTYGIPFFQRRSTAGAALEVTKT